MDGRGARCAPSVRRSAPRVADQADHLTFTHDKHAGHDPVVFRQLFWWKLVLAVPVLLFSDQVQEWCGYSIDTPLAAWIPAVLGIAIFAIGGKRWRMSRPWQRGHDLALHPVGDA